jgi:hypothetical protein
MKGIEDNPYVVDGGNLIEIQKEAVFSITPHVLVVGEHGLLMSLSDLK